MGHWDVSYRGTQAPPKEPEPAGRPAKWSSPQQLGTTSFREEAAALLHVSTMNEGSCLARAWDVSDSVRSR